MRSLGTGLRDLHRVLAERFPVEVIDAKQIQSTMVTHLDQAARAVGELKDLSGPLTDRLLRPIAATVEVQRTHGDFHLAQALMRNGAATAAVEATAAGGSAGSTWAIIDFEGEPLKSPAERRELASPWRDVAGLTRSLDYARHEHPEPDSPAALHWLAEARENFLEGYCAGEISPWLGLYELDKAIYELVYESRNRPAWAAIPRAAIADLLNDTTSPSGA
jgi:maltokinase